MKKARVRQWKAWLAYALLLLMGFVNWMSSRNLSTSARLCNTKTLVIEEKEQEHDPCRGYDGVLRIRRGDKGAAAGTVFFIYMVNYLIYAEMYNLLPWIHLDDTSHRIYDSHVHGAGPKRTFRMIPGAIKTGPESVPREPRLPSRGAKTKMFEITGNGVWESYFDPVSDFSPLRNQTCWTFKPLYEMDYETLAGGMHLESPWAVRAWVYGSVTRSDRKKSIRDWSRPMRRRAASVVRRYIHPKPWVLREADRSNPLEPRQKCVAIHVRTTDKAMSGGRGEIDLEEYLPHVKALLKKFGPSTGIFVATDSSDTLKKIVRMWPPDIVDRVQIQTATIRSNSTEPTFDLASHHRTNREVLIDIYAMAKCSAMIHGRSAVSEAVLYINPDIREVSVDVEDDEQVMNDLGWWDSTD